MHAAGDVPRHPRHHPGICLCRPDGRTPDGLPVIGRLPQKKNKEAASHVAYAFCCGDNGILHAEIASRLLLEQVQGKDNHQLGLFSPNRHWRIKR